MAKRFSIALQNFIATRASINDAFNNGVVMLFSGAQPATADLPYNSSSGSPLIAITESGGVVTKQVDPYFSLEVTSTGTDTLTSFTFAGIEVLGNTVLNGSSVAAATTSLISAINNNNKSPLKMFAILKSGSSTVVNVYLPKNTGASMNTNDTGIFTRTGTFGMKVNDVALTFPDTGATQQTLTGVITATSGFCVVGVNGANLLNLVTSTSGVTDKETGVWSGIAGTDKANTALGTSGFTGFTSGSTTATWFRYYATLDDPELTGIPTTDTYTKYLRYDGSIGTTTAYDMVASGGTSLTYNTTHTVSAFSFTVPTEQA